MSSVAVFDANEVRRLIDHVRASKVFMNGALVFGPAEILRIPRRCRGNLLVVDELGPTEKPGLILAHDDGVYLMSNGYPRDLLDSSASEKVGEERYVAYARGCNPRNDPDWEANAHCCPRRFVADGRTLFDVEQIAAQIRAGAPEIRLSVESGNIRVIEWHQRFQAQTHTQITPPNGTW